MILGLGNLQGEAGGTWWGAELGGCGGAGGASVWALQKDNKSKNPDKRSLVREWIKINQIQSNINKEWIKINQN